MRISDWSSDVCSSDLRGHGNTWQRLESSGRQGGQEYRDLDTGRGATQRRYILRRDRSWQTAGERARQEARSVAQVYELDPAHRDPRVIGRAVPPSQADSSETSLVGTGVLLTFRF